MAKPQRFFGVHIGLCKMPINAALKAVLLPLVGLGMIVEPDSIIAYLLSARRNVANALLGMGMSNKRIVAIDRIERSFISNCVHCSNSHDAKLRVRVTTV